MKSRSTRTAPRDLELTRAVIGGREVLVLSWAIDGPSGAKMPGEAALTPVERDVVDRLLEGKSYREIAHARGTSLRTVSKQVGAVYRKLGVGSRSELAARSHTKR
jgi:DNA-binding CsgD family transcriptional regulator